MCHAIGFGSEAYIFITYWCELYLQDEESRREVHFDAKLITQCSMQFCIADWRFAVADEAAFCRGRNAPSDFEQTTIVLEMRSNTGLLHSVVDHLLSKVRPVEWEVPEHSAHSINE